MEKLVHSALRHDTMMAFDDVGSIKKALVNTMVHVVGKDPLLADDRDWFYALAYVVRGILAAGSIRTAHALHGKHARRVYYLSMEYLLGRSLTKQLLDLDLHENVVKALSELNRDYAKIEACESDAALGNGGLGRLAACFLESIATHAYPGFGYGLRYELGMFEQTVVDGQQVEVPENWLRHGNPWEIERHTVLYPVRFHGKVIRLRDNGGNERCHWVDTDDVVAVAYDVPVSGFRSKAVSNLRLWAARSASDINLELFNSGKLAEAFMEKTFSECLTKVLYPNDSTEIGQELRLKQEYFFVSATLQDIIARARAEDATMVSLPDRATIQLNDTHPALGVVELQRILVDEHQMDFDHAWDIVRRMFCYTNHTLLPEALETWPITLLERVLPRHLQIIYAINQRFLEQVKVSFPGDPNALRRMSLVDDGSRRIRMAHLAVVGSRKINGVAELHTRLMQVTTFRDFAEIYPERFINQTNGVTPRRWLLQANPPLARLITEHIGDGWITDLEKIAAIEPLVDDADFRARFMAVKREVKERLVNFCAQRFDTRLDPATMFDVQVKRIHEYKRQLLNLLHVIHLYNRIRDGEKVAPRTVLIGGKAASSYFMAKLIIRLVNDVAHFVNNDIHVGGRLKLLFLPNYNVSMAEVVIPAADLSEQISTAGTEASGTGNMKFALNGALTIGTLDGANVEIREAVGRENILIFGLETDQVAELRSQGYDPWQHYHDNADLRRVLDMIGGGHFSPDQPDRHRGIFETLTSHGDRFMVLADFDSYVKAQEKAAALFADQDQWARMAILNMARMGRFSSDRTIHGYARDIWGLEKQGVYG